MVRRLLPANISRIVSGGTLRSESKSYMIAGGNQTYTNRLTAKLKFVFLAMIANWKMLCYNADNQIKEVPR